MIRDAVKPIEAWSSHNRDFFADFRRWLRDGGYSDSAIKLYSISGRLALDAILRPDELDALLAAFTAWRASTAPDSVVWVGDDADGWICLPVKDLLAKYPK